MAGEVPFSVLQAGNPMAPMRKITINE